MRAKTFPMLGVVGCGIQVDRRSYDIPYGSVSAMLHADENIEVVARNYPVLVHRIRGYSTKLDL
jgi:hypothetical protein